MTVRVKVERGERGPMVVLPLELAKLPEFQPGREVRLSAAEGSDGAEDTRTLEQIMAAVTPDQLHGEVGWGPPVGKEVVEQ